MIGMTSFLDGQWGEPVDQTDEDLGEVLPDHLLHLDQRTRAQNQPHLALVDHDQTGLDDDFFLQFRRTEQVEEDALDHRFGDEIQAAGRSGNVDHDVEGDVLGLMVLDVILADEEDLLVDRALQDGLARDDMTPQIG